MAEYPTLATAAGTRLLVSTTLPSTHDAAGFAAIKGTATVVGYVTDAGGFPREVREFGRQELLDGTRFFTPNVADVATVSPTFIFQDTDAGQDLIESNADGLTLLAFIYDLPSAMNVGCVGYATGYAPNVTGPNDPVTATVNIQPVFEASGVAVVRWDDAPAA